MKLFSEGGKQEKEMPSAVGWVGRRRKRGSRGVKEGVKEERGGVNVTLL